MKMNVDFNKTIKEYSSWSKAVNIGRYQNGINLVFVRLSIQIPVIQPDYENV